MAVQSAVFALDTHVSFMQLAEFERSEVNRPDPTIDFFETHVLLGGRLTRSSHLTWQPPSSGGLEILRISPPLALT